MSELSIGIPSANELTANFDIVAERLLSGGAKSIGNDRFKLVRINKTKPEARAQDHWDANGSPVAA